LMHLRDCLSTQKLLLGNVHVDIAKSHDCIGNVLKDKRDYDGAMVEYRKCLDIQELVLDRDNADIATTYKKIGLVLSHMGNRTGALVEYEKCYSIRMSVLGTNHPDTIEVGHFIEFIEREEVSSNRVCCGGSIFLQTWRQLWSRTNTAVEINN